MQIFKNNEINLQNAKLDFLLKLGNALLELSASVVRKAKLCIGGENIENYYHNIASGFFNENSNIFYQKNITLSHFLYNLKHNLCNYGVYFYKKNEVVYAKVYSGNGFVLDKNQQNFVEKHLSSNIKLKQKKEISLCKYNDFYQADFLTKMKKEFNIVKENTITKVIYKDIVFVFDNTMNYKIYRKDKEINYVKYFEDKIRSDKTDDEIIREINLKSCYDVVNSKYLLYNKLTNYFDEILTIKFLAERITNDKDNKKLV